MGNWAAIFVKTTDIQEVIYRLKALSGFRTSICGKFPTEDISECVCGNEDRGPTCLALAQTQPDWVMVRHNGLRVPGGWGTLLSLGEDEEWGVKVILASGQSHARSYYFSLYENGRKLREIEYSYCRLSEPVNFGERFGFEGEYPGRNILYGGAKEYVFDYESIDQYAHHFGLEIVPDYDKVPEWIILGAAYDNFRTFSSSKNQSYEKDTYRNWIDYHVWNRKSRRQIPDRRALGHYHPPAGSGSAFLAGSEIIGFSDAGRPVCRRGWQCAADQQGKF